MIPLDRNESYWLLDEELLEACRDFPLETLSTYPRYESLKADIATYAGVSSEQVLLTAGSDAAIEAIADLLLPPGSQAILPVPTFYGYERILDRRAVSILSVCYEEAAGAFVFPYERLRTEIARGEAKALFLCSPNNPFGSSVKTQQLQTLIEDCRRAGMLVVMDEAYYEYSGQTLIAELPSNEHLVILRTFSKGFGIPGVRVGYALAAPSLIERLGAHILPWPVSHMSMYAASVLLARQAAVGKRREKTRQARERFAEALSELPGVVVYPSAANFILIRVPHALDVLAKLRERDVLVADGSHMSRFPEAQALLQDTLRIATPAPEHAEKVLEALRGSLQ